MGNRVTSLQHSDKIHDNYDGGGCSRGSGRDDGRDDGDGSGRNEQVWLTLAL